MLWLQGYVPRKVFTIFSRYWLQAFTTYLTQPVPFPQSNARSSLFRYGTHFSPHPPILTEYFRDSLHPGHIGLQRYPQVRVCTAWENHLRYAKRPWRSSNQNSARSVYNAGGSKNLRRELKHAARLLGKNIIRNSILSITGCSETAQWRYQLNGETKHPTSRRELKPLMCRTWCRLFAFSCRLALLLFSPFPV